MRCFLFAPVLFVSLTAAAAGADDFSTTTPVFAFLSTPTAGEEIAKLPDDATENLTLRPNQAGEFYLYAFNPTKVKRTYTVELRSSRASSQTKVTIPDGKWVRVRLPKPAPPPPSPVATPPAAVPGQPAPPPPEPLPPGSELANTADGFTFTLRLLNEDGTAARDAMNDKPLGRVVTVTVQRPDEYIAPPTPTVTIQDKITAVDVLVQPRPGFVGSAVVTLDFPPQPATERAVIRKGQYRRTLLPATADAEPKARLTGSIENAGVGLKMNVGIDGIERAFIYGPDPKEAVIGAKLTRLNDPAVRVFPTAAFAVRAETQPVAGFPVRVEADNDPKGATLELWVRPLGAKDAAEYEVIRLGGAREEKVWIDVAGPTDAGVFVTSKSRDWIKVLDLQSLRGPHEVIGTLKYKDKNGAAKTTFSDPLLLNVDASGPEGLTIGVVRDPKLKGRVTLVKGKPLPVSAKAIDPETDIVKAVFFVGKPTEDGKIAPDAIKADGVRSATETGVWTADLPIPPEKRGEIIIGVQFFNKVGLSSMQTQKVELIDPPPPSGTIEGVVKIGELPQAGVVVSLRNADGKEVATTKTNDKGKFTFEKVAAGVYSVASSKKDSAYGTAGVAPAQVEVDKTAKVTITMVKQVK